MKYFKIFCAIRSGGMYLKTVLEDNITDIKMLSDELGSCYDPPIDMTGVKEWVARNKRNKGRKSTSLLVKMRRENIQINPIVIIKDPYTWFKSIERWFGRKKLDMIGNYAKYNELYKGCIDLIERPESFGKLYSKCLLIKYEDLLRDPDQTVVSICNLYKIPKENIRNPLILTDKILHSAKFTQKAKKIYLSTGPYKIDTSVINHITSLVDWETIGSYYGYYPMDPRDFHDFSRRMHAQLTNTMRKNEIIPILSKYGADRRVGVRSRSIF